ncbi:MAG: ribonuclease [Caulobacterales bacterium]|nr:ribonuclease [Caulobacterales bacterium]
MTDPTPEKLDSQGGTEAAKRALDGTDVGSDTRAGSLEGGASTGSENDEAQAASDHHLAEMGRAMKANQPKPD